MNFTNFILGQCFICIWSTCTSHLFFNLLSLIQVVKTSGEAEPLRAPSLLDCSFTFFLIFRQVPSILFNLDIYFKMESFRICCVFI